MSWNFNNAKNVYVHPRVVARHPDLTEVEVKSAWRNTIRECRRATGDRDVFVAVGYDSRGRFIEMVYKIDEEGYLIYHAMTPPSKKTIKELRMKGR